MKLGEVPDLVSKGGKDEIARGARPPTRAVEGQAKLGKGKGGGSRNGERFASCLPMGWWLDASVVNS